MLQETLKLLTGNSFFEILLIAVVLDTILGVLRAIKEHKFNSCVGIDGAIRKAAMLLSVGLLMLVDIIMRINILFMIPEQYIKILGIQKLGVCEFFCLLFVLYEAVSICSLHHSYITHIGKGNEFSPQSNTEFHGVLFF